MRCLDESYVASTPLRQPAPPLPSKTPATSKPLIQINKRKRTQPSPPPSPVRSSQAKALPDSHEWLNDNEIEDFISSIDTEKKFFVLGTELASNIVFQGKSSLRRRILAKYDVLFGLALKDNHWRLFFVDRDNRTFSYLDPYGASTAQQ